MKLNIILFLTAIMAVLFLSGCSPKLIQNGGGMAITGNVVAIDKVSNELFTVSFEDGRYSPDTITVKQGAVVIIDFFDMTNSTDVFVVNGYNSEAPVRDGKAELYFKATKKGTFEYGLRTEKSKGKLVVN